MGHKADTQTHIRVSWRLKPKEAVCRTSSKSVNTTSHTHPCTMTARRQNSVLGIVMALLLIRTAAPGELTKHCFTC
jgi:hypothetical protein